MIPSVGESDTSVGTARQTGSAARLAFRLLLAACLGGLIATAILAYRCHAYEQGVTESSRSLLVSLTANAAASLDALARETTSVATSIAEDLTTGRLKKADLVQRIKESTEQHATLLDVAREQNDPDRVALADRVPRRESGIIDHRSTTTGMASWLIYTPVPSTGWSLQTTLILDARELIDGVRAVATGGAPLTADVARKVLDLLRTLNAASAVASGGATPTRFDLTDSEQQILRALVHGFSYK